MKTLVRYSTILGLIFCVCCSENDSEQFKWKASEWSDCTHRDYTIDTCCGTCYKVRNISCVFVPKDEVVPPFHCNKLSIEKPISKESCPKEKCAQDCVLSLWTEWSVCSRNCLPSSKHRMRQILVPPGQGGKACAPLLEVEACSGLQSCLQDTSPEYQWQIGPWTSCRKVFGCFSYYFFSNLCINE